MKADVTHYTEHEGSDWKPWPFPAHWKPTNPFLLTALPGSTVLWIIEIAPGAGIYVRFHALKLSDGSRWDSLNNFNDNKGPR